MTKARNLSKIIDGSGNLVVPNAGADARSLGMVKADGTPIDALDRATTSATIINTATPYAGLIGDTSGVTDPLDTDSNYNTTTTYEGSMPPSVTYRHMVEVPTRSLDSYLLHKQFTYIDLLWIDWYNAELTLLKNILPHTSNTSLIFVRWGNLIDVNGKPVCRRILDLLGDDWNILGLWDADILLYNCRFVTPKES